MRNIYPRPPSGAAGQRSQPSYRAEGAITHREGTLDEYGPTLRFEGL